METFEVFRERFAAVYTAALTDILDKRGYRRQTLPHELRPLVPGTRMAGPAFTILGRPADQPDHDASIRKVLAMRGSIPAVRRLRPEVPGAVDEAIGRSLAKARADRFRTMSEMLAALPA